MRLRALLVALSALAVAVTGCPTASPPDEQCVVGGGVCFEADNPNGCYEQLDLACGTGYVCCTMAYGGNIRDGAVIDAPSGAPSVDAAVDVGADGASDAPHDVVHVPDAPAHLDGSHDGGAPGDGSVSKDGETPKG